MKVERAGTEKTKKFEPVVLTITIENVEELNNLYARVNINDMAIQGKGHCLLPMKSDGRNQCVELFNILDRLINYRYSFSGGE